MGGTSQILNRNQVSYVNPELIVLLTSCVSTSTNLPHMTLLVTICCYTVVWWCNSSKPDWWPKSPRFNSHLVHCQVTTLGKLSHTCASVTKQY